MLKIGRIKYLNTLPLFAPFLTGDLPLRAEIILGTPAELNQKLFNDELDLATISSIEFLRNQDKYHLLPNLGIGARERVMSVFVYQKEGLASLDKKKIGLTDESASAVQLVKILCKNYWKVCPKYAIMDNPKNYQEFDAFLLIGNKALLQPHFEGYRTIDLATAWHQATGLGLPFGVFAVRKTVLDHKRKEIIEIDEALHKALQWSRQHSDAVIELAKQKCNLPSKTIEEYFRVLRFELEEPEMNGLERFSQDSGIPYFNSQVLYV
jgi:chorismate dehydratase